MGGTQRIYRRSDGGTNSRGKALQLCRRITAVVALSIIVLYFVLLGTSAALKLQWIATAQIVPLVLAVSGSLIAFWVIVTLLFGRVYCSMLCPMGIAQDLVARIPRWGRKKRFRKGYRYHIPHNRFRYLWLAIIVLSTLSGLSLMLSLFDPYSAFGRIMTYLLRPLIDSVSGGTVVAGTLIGITVAAATLVVVVIVAFKRGRLICNTICPVGTFLGFFSRFSLFAPVIDTDKCNNCGLCGKQCKASCIDTFEHKIDYSRCVVCMDCIDACKHGAVHYALRKRTHETTRKETTDTGRRAFIVSTAIAGTAVAAKAQDMKVDGGLAAIERAQKPERQTPLVPAGAISQKNFTDHCTACQLCVSVCPNQVLRPSTSLLTLMQPEMSYERGYCRPECNKCSQVCPAGAIKPITVEEKSSIQIGHAVVCLDNCVVNTDEVSCGNCARHCPVGAIRMVRKDPDNDKSLRIPVVNEERCIGCGACENLCPARPFTAIHVEGHEVHKEL